MHVFWKHMRMTLACAATAGYNANGSIRLRRRLHLLDMTSHESTELYAEFVFRPSERLECA